MRLLFICGVQVSPADPTHLLPTETISVNNHTCCHLAVNAINQVMLSWVLDRSEDTRTLFRITGMKRFVDLDLTSPQVQETLDVMSERNIAVDPTIVIHEFGLTARNGETRE